MQRNNTSAVKLTGNQNKLLIVIKSLSNERCGLAFVMFVPCKTARRTKENWQDLICEQHE